MQTEKEQQQDKSKKTAAGWSVFGGGGGQLKELEDCQAKLQIAEEELEAKINENRKFKVFSKFMLLFIRTGAYA